MVQLIKKRLFPIIWGLWNTGNDRTRVNYEGNFTHYEFGNNKYDIYVNGIKQ